MKILEIIMKILKINNSNEKDFDGIKCLKKVLAINATDVTDEYNKMNKRQADRLENLLFKFGEQKETVFKDINNFYGLLNVFIEKKMEKNK